MSFELNKTILLLKRTPIILNAFLKDLPQEWTHKNEGEETWSPFDVVGHLIHGEITDWLPRIEIILNHDNNKNFIPFDRFAQFENSKGKTINLLLEEFEELRKRNISKLLSIDIKPNDLNKTGIHPSFGMVTLSELLATWLAHDLGHIAQISRVLANQYNGEVGPWSEYLRIIS